MSRNLFFYSNIETDLIINSSIALIVRKLKKNYKTILIHPKSDRLSHKSIVNYYQFFDEVKCINFFDIPSHAAGFFKGIKMISSAKKEIQKIKVTSNDKLIMFDTFKYMDVLFFNYLKKNKCEIVIISAFVGDRFKKSNLKVRWHQTLVYNLYSILQLNFKMYIDYMLKNTNLGGYRIYNHKPEYCIAIESSNTLMNSKIESFYGLSFPALLLFNQLFNENKRKLATNNILLVVSSLHGKRSKTYWCYVRKILNYISDDFNIYVKDHPQGKSQLKNELKSDKYFELEQKENMEKLIFEYNIDTVVGYSSTGLITASWMGLRVYDYTSILDYDIEVKDYYKNYLKMGKNITFINDIKEIKSIITNRSSKIDYGNKRFIDWNKLLKTLLND